ncbi:ABC-type metal ion transport system, periplasmic component/surface adhesin [Desulfomonile tiedjei DSM 6799]|uniref:ABC-type metal ion transport system, periplasmic component/surface adhesin n=2 Tax=Desulfomonile tiedjei TaxID=2358 RepID=I4CCW2_DESTA|nr:ABC-type metal ion transport system, periplasmic component/surface adhesin [Desulfomonile tiedjei DSM 6799]
MVLFTGGVFAAVLLGMPASSLTSFSPEDDLRTRAHVCTEKPTAPPENTRPIQVLTGLQATYSITCELCKGTEIRVVSVFPERVPMFAQTRYLGENTPVIKRIASQSAAAITIRSVWSKDPLFAALRAQNIRLVEIDACCPVEPERRSVALIDVSRKTSENTDAKSIPYVWLSLANATRMAEIISEDLIRIAPDESAKINENLARLKRALFSIRSTYNAKFAELQVLEAVTLCPDFIYLTGEFQIDVLDYEPKPEIYWSDVDCQELTRLLRDRKIGVVIHKWRPAKNILDAIHAAGAHLVVLNPMDSSMADDTEPANVSYVAVMEENMRLLHDAFVTNNGN